VFSAWSVQSGHEEELKIEFRDASLPGYDVGSIGIQAE
jgi:hypothetical protein